MSVKNTSTHLNTLINKSQVNTIKVVNLSLLIAKYGPKTHDDMRKLINRHATMSMYTMAMKCYNNQSKVLPTGVRFTIAEIAAYIDDLFVVKTMVGMGKEKELMAKLQTAFPGFFYRGNPEWDITYRVDFCIYHEGQLVAGVQVKPDTYERLTDADKRENVIRNQTFTKLTGKPVFYVYYDKAGHLMTGELAVTLTKITNPEIFISAAA